MKSINIYLPILLFVVVSLTSCQKDKFDEHIEPIAQVSLDNISLDENFNFNLTRSVTINLISDKKFVHTTFDIYADRPQENGRLLGRGTFDSNGYYSNKFSVSTSTEWIVVISHSVGLLNEVAVNTKDEMTINYTSIEESNEWVSVDDPLLKSVYVANNDYYIPEEGFTNQGVPNYLDPDRDIITDQLLEDINASLPEQRPLSNGHTYLDDDVVTNLRLIEDGDVWVTFVHEGAGWKNVLGYYTYDLNNPPQSKNDIDSLKVIFPNSSFKSGGGGLYSGDKVKLGHFTAGTGIGWFLIAHGFIGQNVTNGHYSHYSDKAFNNEPDDDLKQHCILLNARNGEDTVFLIAFEDIRRDYSSCDNDFNDAIFYATANPASAINDVDVPVTASSTDTDGDGVNDNFDEYPNDENKAFNNYFPGEENYGSLAFEDLWPSKGDYDFNDLVINYNVNLITNADNKLVEMSNKYEVVHIGASFTNGFGFELDINPNLISSVTGTNLTEGFISLSNNGTENNQAKATIIPFDNAFLNQDEEQTINISFTQELDFSAVGEAPFNNFLIINRERSQEVHLPGYALTSLGSTGFFQQSDDKTVVENNYTFKTQTGLPWGINIPLVFSIPKEKEKIHRGYNYFIPWAESNGLSYTDWYEDKSGYRDNNFLY